MWSFFSNKNKALYKAVDSENLRNVARLLDRGADACLIDSEGTPLLHLAAKRGNVAILTALLDYTRIIHKGCRAA